MVDGLYNVTLSFTYDSPYIDLYTGGAGLFEYGDTTTISVKIQDGYGFYGWMDEDTGEFIGYTNPYTFTVTRDITLIAIAACSITLDANGGSGGTSTLSVPAQLPVTFNPTSPTRSGYTFIGWADTSTASYATYYNNEVYSFEDHTTLYAVWELNEYTITFDINGGDYGGPDTEIKYHGITMTIPDDEPAREHYLFLGWSTSKTSTTATYTSGANYTGNANATLYAVWKRLYTLTITTGYFYDNNDKTYTYYENFSRATFDLYINNVLVESDIDYFEGEYVTGTKYQIKNVIPIEGHNYKGIVSGALSGTISSSDITSALAFNLQTYTITFNKNGGSTNATPASVTVDYGTYYNISELITKEPTRTGYTYMGWNTMSDGSGDYYAPYDYYEFTESMILYAEWEVATSYIYIHAVLNNSIECTELNKICTYDFYDQNGLWGSNISSNRVLCNYGDTYKIQDIQAKIGHTYNGLANGSANLSGTSYYDDIYITLAFTSNTYTVTYDANEGLNAPSSQIKTHSINLKLSNDVPIREGYTFKGWNTNINGTGTTYQPNKNYTAESSVTLYAQWRRNASIINYNDNGILTPCYIYYNDNGNAKQCITYRNVNGSTVQC